MSKLFPKDINIDQILLKNRVLTLFGEINNESVLKTIKEIIAFNKLGVKDITIYLNSIGGDIEDSFALTDVISKSKSRITCIGLGRIQSCGLLILMSCHKRFIAPNASILSHQYSWSLVISKYHELKSQRTEEDNVRDRIFNHYLKCTGLPKNVIEKDLLCESDVWLTPQQAIKYKLVDKICL